MAATYSACVPNPPVHDSCGLVYCAIVRAQRGLHAWRRSVLNLSRTRPQPLFTAVIRTLDRYVFREVTLTWFAVTGVLLVIMVTNQLALVLQRAADNRFPREVILTLIGFSSLENLTVLVPVGLLLAIVLAFGRLYHESEMAAIQACGVGSGRLYAPVMLLSLALAGLLAWLAFDLAPYAAGRVQELRSLAGRDAQFGNLEPGHFRNFGGGGGVFYAAGTNPDGTLRDVFVKRNASERLTGGSGGIEIAVAARARHLVSEGGQLHTFVLENGRQYVGVPGSAEFRIIEFKEHGIPVRLPQVSFNMSGIDLTPTAVLLHSANLKDRAELQWRMSMPLMALVLTVLAVPLARLRPRQGRYARVGFAILLYLVYSNLLSGARVWMEHGTVPQALGLWWVHALLLAVVLLLINRRAAWRALRARGDRDTRAS
jgi:lipopolysaccharide export system permease protein